MLATDFAMLIKKFINFTLRYPGKVMSRLLLILFCMLWLPVSYAQAIGVQLGDSSVRFNYLTEAWGQKVGKLDAEASVLVNNTDDTLAHLGLLVHHQNIDASLNITVGGRLYYADVNNKAAQMLAFGGEIIFTPPGWVGLGIGAAYFAAPKLTSFGAGEGFSEIILSLHYQITPIVNLFTGYQIYNIQLANENSDRDIEKGSFLGITLAF